MTLLAERERLLRAAEMRDAAEAARRAEGRDEASRRQRVKKLLESWSSLHATLEPDSLELEMDENDAASRIERGDTLEAALEREVRRSMTEGDLGPVSARSIALRVLGAYDEEYAFTLGSLPDHAISAERIYAHVASFESIAKLRPSVVRSIARRATVLLLNRRFCAASAALLASPPAEPETAQEPELCLDCGRDVHGQDPGCASCEPS